MRTAVKISLAAIAFAAVHSALASLGAKRLAGRWLGEEKRDAVYRVFFVVQSLAGFGALLAYGARLPTQTLYRIEGPGALLLRAGQAAGAAYLLIGLKRAGVAQWSGYANLQAWRRGLPMPPVPAAQGPELKQDGRLGIGGPYLHSRHPLNFAGIPIFWLTPHMTARRLAFNAVGTLYLILGSRHEEIRLQHAYGELYQRYVDRRVSFFWPLPAGGTTSSPPWTLGISSERPAFPSRPAPGIAAHPHR
jgi:protein-S-isoprenylcysteine O-methyltransferase Ste14